MSRAVLIRRFTTSPADICGQWDRIRAAVAATSGVAKLVPCTRQYPPGRAPTRPVAGAVRIVAGPVIEPDQRLSLARSRPATAITPGSRAGYQTLVSEDAARLPVQATTTTSRANA